LGGVKARESTGTRLWAHTSIIEKCIQRRIGEGKKIMTWQIKKGRTSVAKSETSCPGAEKERNG